MSRSLRAFDSHMLPRFYIELWNSNTSPGPIGGIGVVGGGGGAGSSGGGAASSSSTSVLSLHDVAKPLGKVIQLGQQAQSELGNAGRNTAINSAHAGAHGTRRPSPRGMGSNNTPIAFFGGGALEGRGGPSVVE